MKKAEKEELDKYINYLKDYLGADGIVNPGDAASAKFATAISRCILILAEEAT